MSRRPGAPDGPGPGVEIRCGLCGVPFREDRGQPACAACPLARACRYVRCPRCGFENPVTPGWMEPGAWGRWSSATRTRWSAALRAAWDRARAWRADPGRPTAAGAAADPFTGLADLRPGGEATVVGLADPSGGDARALAGLGLLPGAEVEVVQRYPAWILRVDRAEIAVDDDLARQVRVRMR